MASIADVFFKALLDTAQLQVDAVKAGDKAGQTMGTRMSAGLKSGLKTAAFGGLTAGLTLATKGVLELENVTADFTAQTGVAGEEAQKAGKAINEMAGSNIQPMTEIGDALAKVHTDMGLTGDAAVDLTKDFLRFGRATKQNATSAVLAFDDILDSWGLTADKSAGLMDQLIVSHQKFGGSIEDNEKTLAALAPSMRAANFEIDDAIGLLNLFGAKGLDANTASAAFSKALTKVKSPEELKALIEDISNTVDPFERAEKAAELFGARAGAKLANALGGANLDDYTVSVEEAAGATEDAADAMDSTFGARMQLLLKGFSSKLTEVGSSFGPVLTGLAALTSLAGTLRLDKALAGIWGKVGVGGAIRGAATKAGAIAGAIYSRAVAISVKLVDALAGLFTKLPGSSKLIGATEGAGKLLGGKFGIAFQLAAVFAVAAIADELNPIVSKAGQDLGDTLFGNDPNDLRHQAGRWLESLPWPIGPKGAPDWARIGGEAQAGAEDVSQSVADGFSSAGAGGLTGKIADDLAGGAGKVGAAADDVGDEIEDGIGDGADDAATAVQTASGAILTSLQQLRTDVGAAAAAAAGEIFDPMIKEAELAQTKRDIAEQTRIMKDKESTKAQIREARLRRTELEKQLFVQITDLTTYGTDAERIARIDAALASKSVAEAYANGTPAQRAAIDEWRAALVAERGKLTGAAEKSGTAAGTAAAGALADTKPKITTAAEKAVSGVPGAMKGTGKDSRAFGAATAQAYADGIRSKVIATRNAAIAVSKAAQTIWRATSPPGPESPLHDIDKWGANTVQAYAEGLESEIPTVRKAAVGVAGAAAPTMAPLGANLTLPTPAAPAAGAATAGLTTASGRDTYNINVPVQGLVRARDPLEIAGQLRRLAELGVLAPKEARLT